MGVVFYRSTGHPVAEYLFVATEPIRCTTPAGRCIVTERRGGPNLPYRCSLPHRSFSARPRLREFLALLPYT